jgi:PhnB protein
MTATLQIDFKGVGSKTGQGVVNQNPVSTLTTAATSLGNDPEQWPAKIKADAMARQRILERWTQALASGDKHGVPRDQSTAPFLHRLRRSGMKLSKATLYNWKRSFNRDGVRGLVDARRLARSPTHITATLSVKNYPAALQFYITAFHATVLHEVPGGGVAQLSVNGADFWIAEESPEHLNFSPDFLGGSSVRMLLITEDPHALCAQAVAAGATQIVPVTDQHGWRLGLILDPAGHHWEIGKPL